MKTYRNIIIIILLLCIKSYAHAQNIEIHNFDELVNSNPRSGDTLTFSNDLSSDSTIGDHFWNLDIRFEGDNHYINGNEEFGGFVLNQDSIFSRVGIRNCQGQTYDNSKFAGAVFNSGGYTDIEESGFIGNFVDSGGYNFAVAGAVYNLNGGTIDINNSLFQDNYSHGASAIGGAVANGYLEGPDAIMNINNSIFLNNNCEGTVVPHGGAIYNDGLLSINNTRFEGNHVFGKESFYQSGGAIYNSLGDVSITNSNIIGNYIEGGDSSISRGGAIYNNNNMTIDNSVIKGNYIDSNYNSIGGAIYNDYQGNLTIKNSLVEDNHLTDSADTADGGAIFNVNKLVIEIQPLEIIIVKAAN